MNALKKFWKWMKCEDEAPAMKTMSASSEIPVSLSARYSELITQFPIHGKIGKEYIIHMSHKLDDGSYETCYVTVKQLKDAIIEMA